MKTKHLIRKWSALLALALAPSLPAQTSNFSYQGQLTENGAPANGLHDLTFTLYGSSGGVDLVAGPITNSPVVVSSGIFTTMIDFGAGVFDGSDRWLEIGVRTNGSTGDFAVLSPRQHLTATPYAIKAGGVDAAGLMGTISPNNIGAESITTVMLAAGAVGANQLAAGAVTTEALADGAVTAPKVATVSNWFALTIPNPTPEVGDSFSWSVAAVGADRVLIGSLYDDTGAMNAGAAYLFSTNGTLLTTFTNPMPDNFDSFGFSVTAVGNDQVLIGTLYKDEAYLFNTDGALVTTITNPVSAVFDNFGASLVTMGSDRVLIGACRNDTGANDAGAAYLFSTNGTLLTTFTNPTPADEDLFGWAIAVMGTDRVLIGADGDDTGATNAGAAYLFTTNGMLLTTFTNPAPAAYASFGQSVATVGTDRVLIGAFYDDTGADGAGAAYLFSTNGALLTTFTNPTPAYGDEFGWSVAAVGTDRVLIGSLNDDTAVTNSGAVYLFSTNGELLTTITNPTPANGDWFGYAVALVGSDRLLIAATKDDSVVANAGVAYLFSLKQFTAGLVADSVRPRAVTTESLEDGAVTAPKIGGVLYTSQIPDLDASKITSGTLSDAQLSANVARTNQVWLLAGNAGTTAGTHFLGTTDDEPLEIKVNNQRTLRLEPQSTSPNLIGGYSGNSVASGTEGAVIAGGGTSARPNTIGTGSGHGAIGGGLGNTIADGVGQATIAGGELNDMGLDTAWSAIGGGYDNSIASNSWAVTIAGGYANNVGVNADNSTIGGGRQNTIASDSFWSTIAGGHGNYIGVSSTKSAVGGGGDNAIADNSSFAVLGGGENNLISTFADHSTIGGGEDNRIESNAGYATISGGIENYIGASSYDSSIGGGYHNYIIASTFATISGGYGNDVGTNAGYSSVGGGQGNNIAHNCRHATISGGQFNDVGVDSPCSSITGGYDNNIGTNSWFATIGGGYDNDIGANSLNTWVGGGNDNNVADHSVSATICGGSLNDIGMDSQYSSVGGGFNNNIGSNSFGATISGGYANDIGVDSQYSSVGGGEDNNIASKSTGATISGGYLHHIASNSWGATISGGGSINIGVDSPYSAVGGGRENNIFDNAPYATIPGGYLNSAASYAFAAGRRAKANHTGAFVWADNTDADYASSSSNQFCIRASGGLHLSDATSLYCGSTLRQMVNLWSTNYGIGVQNSTFYSRSWDRFCWYRYGSHTDSAANPGPGGTNLMTLDGGGSLFTAGGMYPSSDRNIKKNFEEVEPGQVLKQLMSVPIQKWSYKSEGAIRHLGPVAQDFRAAFGLGVDDKHIGTLDADGVALAAIQGLNQQVEDTEARIQKLEALNAELRARLEELEELLEEKLDGGVK